MEHRIKKWINGQKTLYCYGAGEYAFFFSCYCEVHGICIEAYIVSQGQTHCESYLGRPVFLMDSVLLKTMQSKTIVVALSEQHHQDVKKNLPPRGAKIFLREQDMACILDELANMDERKWDDISFLDIETRKEFHQFLQKRNGAELRQMYGIAMNPCAREFHVLWNKYSYYPRFHENTIMAGGWEWHLPDVLSFLYQYKAIFMNRIYEFRPKTEDHVTIVDFGINVGVSLRFFFEHYPTATIEGYEADPSIYQYCKENTSEILASNNLSIFNIAVWDCDTVLTFLSEGADAGRITESSTKDATIQIPAIDVNRILEKFAHIDFLKIDIEGAEGRVLRRAATELKKVDYLFVEYHSLIGKEQELDEILHILKKYGFRVYLETSPITKSPFMIAPNSYGFDVQANIYAKRV